MSVIREDGYLGRAGTKGDVPDRSLDLDLDGALDTNGGLAANPDSTLGRLQ